MFLNRFLLCSSVALASASPEFNGAFCGVVSGVPNFVSDSAASQMAASGIDWFWNYDTKTEFHPSGLKFVPMQWGILTNPGDTTTEDYYKYPQYMRHWKSLSTNYPNIPKDDTNGNVVFGWNEPDAVGICNDNKRADSSKPECRKGGDNYPIDYCNFYDPDHEKACPKFMNEKNNASDYDPSSWEYERYWCCCSASGSGWWTPELINVWRTETTGKPDRFKPQLLDAWKAYASEVRASGYLLGSPSVANRISDWLEPFAQALCPGESCPDYLVFHHYDTGCKATPGPVLEKKIQDAIKIIQTHPSIKGMMITELGLLTANGKDSHDKCPHLTAYMENIFALFQKYKKYIAGVSWFSVDGTGAVYDLSLFDIDGNINDQGQTYMRLCKSMQQDTSAVQNKGNSTMKVIV